MKNIAIVSFALVLFVTGVANLATAGEIHGTKFNDLNGNGIHDSCEPALEGWKIFLDLNDNGIFDVTEPNTITDSSGNYEFTDLTADTYTVAEVNQTGWVQTLPGWVGGRLFATESVDSNSTNIVEINPNDGNVINSFSIPQPTLMLGLGGVAAGPTSLFVANAVADGDGIRPVIWELDADTGSVFDYDELNLGTDYIPRSIAYLDGKVYMVIDEIPYSPPTQTDIVVWDPTTDQVVTTIIVSEVVGDGLAGDSINGVLLATSGTMGLEKVAKIDPATGTIVGEINHGIIPCILLAYVDGTIIRSRWSSPFTTYLIDPETGTTIDTYEISSVSSLEGLGGDGIPSQRYKVILKASETISLDFGNVGLNLARIKGTKWNDLNGDAIRDQNEPVLEGWKIYVDANENGLWDEGELYDVTDSNGTYEFTGLAAGTYTVAEVNQTDWQQTFPGGDGKHSVFVNVGRTVENVDFGNASVFSSRINGIIWNDLDANGVQDQGESVLEGWVVYLDLNNNGRLDGSELSTLTDANGMYEFTGIAQGSYPVAIVGQCNWRATSPLISKQELIEISNPRDLAYDYQRNLLYISTGDGNIERYNLLTRNLLNPFTVGTSLNGMDITPDCNFLYVTEDDTSGNVGRLHKVNLSNGAVTDITFSRDFGEGGSWDIKIGSCGKGLMTTQYNGSGDVPLRELALNTDTMTIRTDIPGGGVLDLIAQDTRVFRSADRKFLMLSEEYYTDIYTYDAVADTLTVEPKKAYFLALNRDASIVAKATISLIEIFTRDFSYVTEIPTGSDNLESLGGIAFDSIKDVFYYADSEFNQLVAVETRLWEELDRINIPEGIDDYPPLYDTFNNGVMKSSEDGRFLALTKNSGVYLFKVDGSQIINVGLCETVNNVDFGQQRHMAGDFDGDRDVDIEDLKTFSEQWLLEKLSADIAPYCPDGIINFLDWAVFANAWQSTSEPPSANWNPKCDIAPDGGDGVVDIDDLTVFVSQWLQLSVRCVDIAPVYDGDGIVNMLDFAALAENWLWEE